MPEVTNSDRADWGILGLQTFRNRVCHGAGDRDLSVLENFEEALADMLGNLVHYARLGLGLDQDEAKEIISNALDRGIRMADEETKEGDDE